MIDRELHLRKVPDEFGFAVKPRRAEAVIERIVPDLPAGWIWAAADEVDGRDGAFRSFV